MLMLLTCKRFTHNSSANIKLSKTQLHKIGQSGQFSSRLFVLLLKAGLPLMKKVLKPLARSVSIRINSSVSNRCSYS